MRCSAQRLAEGELCSFTSIHASKWIVDSSYSPRCLICPVSCHYDLTGQLPGWYSSEAMDHGAIDPVLHH